MPYRVSVTVVEECEPLLDGEGVEEVKEFNPSVKKWKEK